MSAAGPSLDGITMRLTVELGRAEMPAGRTVGLPAGSVVELDADVDAPVDLYVNGVRFASARLLVTDDGEWAVRIEDVEQLEGPRRGSAVPDVTVSVAGDAAAGSGER